MMQPKDTRLNAMANFKSAMKNDPVRVCLCVYLYPTVCVSLCACVMYPNLSGQCECAVTVLLAVGDLRTSKHPFMTALCIKRQDTFQFLNLLMCCFLLTGLNKGMLFMFDHILRGHCLINVSSQTCYL